MDVTLNIDNLLEKISFNEAGLVPAIAQQFDSGEVLMMAWMDKEAIVKTLSTKQVHYFSRSRHEIWRKGQSSGQVQKLIAFNLDCDGDAILLRIDQKGVACHTGRGSCFYISAEDGRWVENQAIKISPKDLYNE